MNLREKILNDEVLIDKALEEYLPHQKAYNDVIEKIENEQDKLVNDFMGVINEKLKTKNCCLYDFGWN